ncbi:hypothetical protein [Aureimonas psammosilenae]|uniref:hypothetical protein n=1 Tax=Aureimonas psammosilenae TaxID=2495496 RepID=UPI001260B557|nr:hypothetical protein [Aureimonas psammosilenae]
MKINVVSKGGKTKGLMSILDKYSSAKLKPTFESVGKAGLQQLVDDTPVRSGKTANSWTMDITEASDKLDLIYSNSNTVSDGTPLVVLIKQGHGTRNGGYVPPNDFITPIVEKTAKELSSKIGGK